MNIFHKNRSVHLTVFRKVVFLTFAALKKWVSDKLCLTKPGDNTNGKFITWLNIVSCQGTKTAKEVLNSSTLVERSVADAA
ncbi:MAG: hypothetical protein ABIX01_13920 [Chitinophagaceae bacterium]